MRSASIALVFVVALSSVPAARAETTPDTPPEFPALLPTPIRLNWNAHAITLACTKCPNHSFCMAPLEQPIPEAEQIEKMMNGRCDRTTPPEGDKGIAGSAGIPGFGPAWQADVISGLATFLVKRAKAEAIASFVHHMQKELCTTEAAPIMQTTCSLLAGSEPYRDPVPWSALKAAIKADLRALPERGIRVFVPGDLSEPLVSLVQIVGHLGHGANPLETLAGLQIKYASINTPETCEKRPYPCSLRVLGIATEIMAPQHSRSLREISDRNYLDRYLTITARLLHEAGKSIGIPDDIRKLPEAAALVSRIVELLERVRDQANIAKQQADKPATARSTFASYLRAASEVLAGLRVAALLPELSKKLDPGKLDRVLDHLVRCLEHANAGEYVDAFVELRAALAAAGHPTPPWLSKYGAFLAEVASVKNKDDMQRALEAAASPVGAWQRKRGTGRRSLTLNGYVGFQGGYEWLIDDDSPSGRARHGGLFAPVGIEASLGFKKWWSAGILVSAIDLGALVDLRESTSRMTDAGEQQVDTNATLGFRQVFSPGLYAVVGIGLGEGGIPLTFGFGASLTPELRSISLDDTASRDVNALRVNAFLAIDITIFELQ